MFVSAVILAAGASSRFGSPKLLAEIDGEPILRRVTRTFSAAGFDEVLVVLPPGDGEGLQDSLRRSIEDLSATVRSVENSRWQDGMFSSVKAGLAAATAGRSTHVAVSPADLPFLGEDSLRRVMAAAAEVDERTLVVPTHSGRRGHPLLFSTALAPRILSWPDDRRLSSLFEESDLAVLHLGGFDEGILRDVDCPRDLSSPSLHLLRKTT
ncbi:MAG TPA: nucleotidyltransferase family protein [Thermoanaerobaculia bacterium]|nr:nucleotidyltransferase family protein [Thermoanaerobaculia bacterium]